MRIPICSKINSEHLVRTYIQGRWTKNYEQEDNNVIMLLLCMPLFISHRSTVFKVSPWTLRFWESSWRRKGRAVRKTSCHFRACPRSAARRGCERMRRSSERSPDLINLENDYNTSITSHDHKCILLALMTNSLEFWKVFRWYQAL